MTVLPYTLPHPTVYARERGRSCHRGHHFEWREAHVGWRYEPSEMTCRRFAARVERPCPHCDFTSLNPSATANHIRWKHPKAGVSKAEPADG